MELAVVSYFNTRLPLGQRLELIREAGFSTISIWGEYPIRSGFMSTEGRALVKALAAKEGLSIHSIHAPFGKANDLFSHNEEDRNQWILHLKQGIQACDELGAKILIVHLQKTGADMRGKEEIGLASLRELLPELQGTGVKIALENLQSAKSLEVLNTFFEELPEEFGLCYDSSHDFISPEPMALLKRWGDRLLVTHLSDNHLRLDEHLLPWEGMIDWDALMSVFPWKSYPGPLLLESEMLASSVKEPARFLEELCMRGKRLLSYR